MKVPCPSCAQPLTLPDKMAGKIAKCPACQKSFSVPGSGAKPGKPGLLARISGSRPGVPDAPPAPPSADELALRSVTGEAHPDAPPRLEACPYCGTPWREGQAECGKCHYNVVVGKRMHRHRTHLSLNFDVHKLFLYAVVIGLILGLYWLFNNWNRFRENVSNRLDNATRTEPSADDRELLIRKDSTKKPLSRD